MKHILNTGLYGPEYTIVIDSLAQQEITARFLQTALMGSTWVNYNYEISKIDTGQLITLHYRLEESDTIFESKAIASPSKGGYHFADFENERYPLIKSDAASILEQNIGQMYTIRIGGLLQISPIQTLYNTLTQ